MKFTSIEMEWNEKGAKIRSTIPIVCPTCGEMVNLVHACGDQAPKPKKQAAARKGKA